MVRFSETERKERMDTNSIMEQILSKENLNTAYLQVVLNKAIEWTNQVYLEHELPIIYEYLLNNSTIENLGILLVFKTGIRVGELVALKPEDISKSMHISRTEIKYNDVVNNKVVREIKALLLSRWGMRIYHAQKSIIILVIKM